MPQETDQLPRLEILAIGHLGPDNIGTFGPNSPREAGSALDFANEEYRKPVSDESHCMDDRCEEDGIRLPSNRATTEDAAEKMDPNIEPKPVSQTLPDKIQELEAMGHPAFFHVQCAALMAYLDGSAFRYIGEHARLLTSLSIDRLRLAGIDHVNADSVMALAKTAGERGHQPVLWDMAPEQVLALTSNIDYFKGDHSPAGAGMIVSAHTHDGLKFRHEHQNDLGEPLGMFTITLGAYIEQLRTDEFTEQEISDKVIPATLFSVAILKVAQKENAPDVIAG